MSAMPQPRKAATSMAGGPSPPDELAWVPSPRQEELIRHAYELFGRKGIQKTTMQDVADAAGVSKAAVIYYFNTKEELALRTVEWVLARVATRIKGAIAPEDSPAGKVRAMIDAIFIDPERNRRFYITYTDLIGQSSRNERFNSLSTSFREIVNQLYADVIESGRGKDFIVTDVDDAATAVRAIIDGFFLQWLGQSDWRAAHPAYKSACTRTVLAYLRSGP
jgi:TetR/AcrR family transcriptional regulator, fatty acid metabolism regulator protein